MMDTYQSKTTHLLNDYYPEHDIADNEHAFCLEEEEEGQKSTRRKQSFVFERKRTQPSGRPGLLLAPQPHHYFASGFIHCCVIRSALQSPLRVQFLFQKFGAVDDKTAMVAIKQGGINRISSYHIFDTVRVGGWTAKNNSDAVQLNKKAGNYIGKLRREKNDRSTYSLYDSKEQKEQIGAFQYSLPSLAQQWSEGQPPRKMQVAIPTTDKEGAIEPRASYLKNRLIDNIKKQSKTAAHLFSTKEPTYDNGQYRLNFSGRVTTASVKNMQIVDSKGEIFLQFGKVGDHRFHLDYKAPFNAYQAFGLALTAMDL